MQCGDAEFVKNTFGRIASKYDFFNHLLTMGVDRWWRRVLVKEVLKKSPKNVLDLATGSGDVALALMKGGVEVTGLDFCGEMLELAKKKGVKNLIRGDILNLPLEDEKFDAVTISFGVRNLTDRARGLREMRRVLRTGGWLYVLEFSQPWMVLRPFYFFYLRNVMPLLAKIFGGEAEAYRYLASSIKTFPAREELKKILEETGFSSVRYWSLMFGMVAMHRAQKGL